MPEVNNTVAWFALILSFAIAVKDVVMYFWVKSIRVVRFERRIADDEIATALHQALPSDPIATYACVKIVSGNFHATLNEIFVEDENGRRLPHFDLQDYKVDLAPDSMIVLRIRYLDLQGAKSVRFVVKYNGGRQRRSSYIPSAYVKDSDQAFINDTGKPQG